MRYEVHPDGYAFRWKRISGRHREPGEEAWDGMKVDGGQSLLAGPGGLWIVSPEGKHLGTIVGAEDPHNIAWGGSDHKTLYLAAQTGLYRIEVNVAGAGQPRSPPWTDSQADF